MFSEFFFSSGIQKWIVYADEYLTHIVMAADKTEAAFFEMSNFKAAV